MNDNRKKAEWFEDKKFERDGLCVAVQKLPLYHPRYSLIMGTPKSGDSGDFVSRFIPIFSKGQGLIEIKRVSNALAELTLLAEEYILSELQYLEDTRIETNQRYEERDLNKGKPRAQVGIGGGPGSGKTARKRANRAARMAKE